MIPDLFPAIRKAIDDAFADTFRTANRVNAEAHARGEPQPFVASDPGCFAALAVERIVEQALVAERAAREKAERERDALRRDHAHYVAVTDDTIAAEIADREKADCDRDSAIADARRLGGLLEAFGLGAREALQRKIPPPDLDEDQRAWWERGARSVRLERDLDHLRGAMAADDERLARAGKRVGIVEGCDTAEAMADAVEDARAQLAAARAAGNALRDELRDAIGYVAVWSREKWGAAWQTAIEEWERIAPVSPPVADLVESIARDLDCEPRDVMEYAVDSVGAPVTAPVTPPEHCNGEWTGGSGGHRNHRPDCNRTATWRSDGYRYCDKHLPAGDTDAVRIDAPASPCPACRIPAPNPAGTMRDARGRTWCVPCAQQALTECRNG